MEKGLILYPCYFDATLTRAEGRRVSRDLAVPEPTLSDLVKAAKLCGVAARIEKKSHPAFWWKYDGRLVIEQTGKKEELIRNIARHLESHPPARHPGQRR